MPHKLPRRVQWYWPGPYKGGREDQGDKEDEADREDKEAEVGELDRWGFR